MSTVCGMWDVSEQTSHNDELAHSVKAGTLRRDDMDLPTLDL